LGSNLGDRAGMLASARRELSSYVAIGAESTIYETEPWGYLDQPRFLNQVIEGSTQLAPTELLSALKRIEWQLGRRPTFRYGPRQIDLDLLAYDDLIMDTPDLQIPHPRLPERAFVLVPMKEIAPEWTHPSLGLTANQLADRVDGSTVRAWRAADKEE
jgi:2-amino-4-hydroxy-6-hydroxymethyldihydropteridine diphosphokinase